MDMILIYCGPNLKVMAQQAQLYRLKWIQAIRLMFADDMKR